KVRENEKLISIGWEKRGQWGAVVLVIWSGCRRGPWWETGTVKYDVLRGINLVSGQWIYMRKSMAAKEVISFGVEGDQVQNVGKCHIQ
ncbi:hypothetical protein DVA81_18575, partial [Acinetobacter baumannii]